MTKQKETMQLWRSCVSKAKKKLDKPQSYGIIKGKTLKLAQTYFCAQGK